MGYNIDIIDMNDDTHVVSVEHAEATSIRLKWHGTDAKDENNILGSSLFFSLEAHISTNKDAMFSHLFTSEETRYQVRFYDVDTDVDIWTGFLLPESYDEPYTANTFYVNLEATDGLGRLKGKYFDDSFYTDTEIGVVQLYADCLSLTGLQLPILMAPAIKNSSRDRYDDIFLPGAFFLQGDKKMSVYDILKKLAHDMLCQIRQVENKWEIVGFNQMHKTAVTFDTYAFDGTFSERVTIDRLIKTFRPLGEPNVSIVPPYKTVTVSHERVRQGLPDTIGDEENEGWVIGQGVNGDIFPTHWYGNGGYYPKALSPDYKVTLPTAAATDFDNAKFISLLRKIYVNQYDKMVFTLRLKSEVPGNQDNGSFIENGVRVTFKLNGSILYQVNNSFKDNELLFQFDLYANESGLLDLEIGEPYFNGTLEDETFPQYITIDYIELKRIGSVEEETFIDEVASDYSIEKEWPLEIADDMTGFSQAFRLQRLNDKSAAYNSINVPILYSRSFQGKNYVVLDLFGTNLVKDNIEGVYHLGAKLDNVSAEYNFLNGDEMVVEVPNAIASGSLEVRRFRIADVTEDRKYWEQWSDTVFPIETDRYGEAAAKVFRRLFMGPFEMVSFVSESAYKINDIINFDYVLPNNYFFTSLEWNVDAGTSVGTMVKGVYENQVTDIGAGNISPIVNAGEDIVVAQLPVTGTQLQAVAFDPDGFIAAVNWEVVGGSGIIISNGDTLSPTIYPDTDIDNGQLIFLTQYPVTLRVTVTDDDGATASDELVIEEETAHVISLVNELDFVDYKQSSKKEVLQVSPELPDDTAIKLKGVYRIRTIATMFGAPVEMICSLQIEKNGVVVFKKLLSTKGEFIAENGDFEFNYIKGDVVEFFLQHTFIVPAFGYAGNDGNLTPELVDKELVYFQINNVSFQAGAGVVSGYPLESFVIDV